MVNSLRHGLPNAQIAYAHTPEPAPQRQTPLTQLLERFKDGKPLPLTQQKQTLHLLDLLDRPTNRDRPSELKGRSITLRDEEGVTCFTLIPEQSNSRAGRIAIQAQGDGLFHGIDVEAKQTASGPFLHTLLSALRGTDAYTSQADTDDLARRLSDYAHTHTDAIERLFESLESSALEQGPAANETNSSGDVQGNMLRNVLTRTASQVATRMAARLVDRVIEGTVLEGIKFDELAQLKPALEQFRSSERSLTQGLQSLADALGRVARTPGSVAARAQQCLELCLKTARIAETIGSEGLSLDTTQRALSQLAETLEQPLLQDWSEASGARSALVRASQWLGELAPLLGHDTTLESFLGSLSESPVLREMLSVQYQGLVAIFDELGALFGALRERHERAPSASPLNQAAWLLDLMDSGRLGPLLSTHSSGTFAALVDPLHGVGQTLDALRQFPVERPALQQLQWVAERLSRKGFEAALPGTLLDSIRQGAKKLADITSVSQEIGPLPVDASLREQTAWLARGMNHLEIKGLMADLISRDNGFAILNQRASQAKELYRRLAQFPGAQEPLAALRWLCELSSDDSAMALLDEWLPANTRQALAAWVAPLQQALHLAPQLARYPVSGDWRDKLAWGAQLLIANEAPAFLRQILPESLAPFLLKPFEALRQAQDFPVDASPLAQLESTIRLLASPEHQALLRQYAPAGYDQWLARLGELSALSQSAATLHRTLAGDSAWSSKVKDLAQLLMQPLAEELKRHPELLLKTASWTAGGNKTTVGAALTALRIYATMPQDLSNTEKAAWIFKTALREALNEYNATLSLAVSHRDKFRLLLTYAKQTMLLYRAWSDSRKMERELGNLAELLKGDLPLPEHLKPLLDALPALPALLRTHEQYKAPMSGMPWLERIDHIGGQLSHSDNPALKRILDSLEAYAVNGLVECASQAMQAFHNYEIYDPLKFPGAEGATLPPTRTEASAPYQQKFETTAAKNAIDPFTTRNKKEATELDAPSPPNTAAYAMAGGGALGLFGSLALLGYALYQRTHGKEATQPFLSIELQEIKSPLRSLPDTTDSASRGAESEDLIASEPESSHDAPKRTGMLQSTPALLILGLLAGASGAVMAKGIHDLNNATDETGAEALAPVDEFEGLELIDALDTLNGDVQELLAHGEYREGDGLQRVVDDIERTMALLVDIEGALGIELDDWAQGTMPVLTIDNAHGRKKRDISGESSNATRNDIQTQQTSLSNLNITLQKDPNDLSALAQLKRMLSRLRHTIDSLPPSTTPATQTENLSMEQTRKAKPVIQAVEQLLEAPELPPNPIDFLEIQLTALAAKYGCLDKIDRNTEVEVDYVSQRARYGLHTMTAAETRSVRTFYLIDILRREHIRFLNKHNENPGYEKISFNDRTLPSALLDDALAIDIEAQYNALIDNFRTEPDRNQARLEKRLERLRKNILEKTERYLKVHSRHRHSEFLRKFLRVQKASQVKLVMPGIAATLKDTFFVDTKNGGGFLFFLNSPRVYKIPGSLALWSRYIEKNQHLQSYLKSALPLYEQLCIGDKKIRFYYKFISATGYIPRWSNPLEFEETPDIVNALSDIGLAHNIADMDTLAVSDREISWDKWIAALSFSSTLLSLALPIAASVPKLASRAMLLGVFNTVQTLGLSIAPNVLKSMYADFPEERTQALREAIVGLIAEAGGWSLIGLSKMGAFTTLSEKIARIVVRMKTTTKAQDLAQQFAETWKNNREKLLGSLDRISDALPFEMESLPTPLLNRLDKQLLKVAVNELLPDADNDTDLDHLLDRLEQKRQELLDNQGRSRSDEPSGTTNSKNDSRPIGSFPLNEKLQELIRMIPSSPNQDGLLEVMRHITVNVEQLDFGSPSEEEADSPRLGSQLLASLQALQLLARLQALKRDIDRFGQSPNENKTRIDFQFFYDAIEEAIRRGLDSKKDRPTVFSPLNEELQHLLQMMPSSISSGELLPTMQDIEHAIFLLDFNSYFRAQKNSPIALITERLVNDLIDRLHVLKQKADQSTSRISSIKINIFNSLHERALNHISRKFPSAMLDEKTDVSTNAAPAASILNAELKQLEEMIPSSVDGDDFLKIMTYIEHRVALLDFTSHSKEDSSSSLTQETKNLTNRFLATLQLLKHKVDQLRLTPDNLNKIRGFKFIYDFSVDLIIRKSHASENANISESTPWIPRPLNESLQQLLRIMPASIDQDDFITRVLDIESNIIQLEFSGHLIEEADAESTKETRELINTFLAALQALKNDIDELQVNRSNVIKLMDFYSCYHISINFMDHRLLSITAVDGPPPTNEPALVASLNDTLRELVQAIPLSIDQNDFISVIADIGYKIAKLDYSSYFRENLNSPSAVETRSLIQNILAGLQALKQHLDQHEIQPSSITKALEFDFFHEASKNNIILGFLSKVNGTSMTTIPAHL